MSSDSLNLTQKWLRHNIATYDDRDRVFSDVDSTLSAYSTLRPKTDIYSSLSRPIFASSLTLPLLLKLMTMAVLNYSSACMASCP
jgi:hypothetical protein